MTTIHTSPGQSRKNVIWIFGDQHRAQALGCNGDPNVLTPNIDNLAASGVNFDRALTGFPLCCPSRGTMLTGCYAHKVVPGHQYQLPAEQPTIAHVLNDNGYHTAYFGKWHLDGFNEREGRAAFHIVPPERRGGFQEWAGYENNNSQWDCWVHGGEGENAFHGRLPGFETDALTDMFIDYIRTRGQKRAAGEEQPFFAVLSVQPPHDPYIAPADMRKSHNPAHIQLRPNVPQIPRLLQQARNDLAGYYAMIENLDWNVGKIRAALDEAGLSFDTHIVFFSDHGDMHGSQGQFKKTSPWEEAIRVPMIISGEQPFYGRKTGRSPTLFSNVDLAPTTLGLCGIDKPSWMDGTDYSSRRIGSRPSDNEPDSAYLQCVVPTGHAHSVDRAWRGIVTNDGWKYVCFEQFPWLMFNLNEDPYEQSNLAYNSAYHKERKRLNDRLQEWIHTTGDHFTLPKFD